MNILHYCIPQAICGLCSFGLSDGQSACAVIGEHAISEFSFRRFSTFVDENLGIKIHMCLRGSCYRRHEATAAFHQECYKYGLATVTPALLAIHHHDFTPSPGELQPRVQYIKEATASNLSRASFWPYRIPNEIWLHVAEFLVTESAIHTSQALAASCSGADNVLIDFTKPIYAFYVKVYGTYYVKSLSNSLGANTGEGGCLILPGQDQQGRDKVNLMVARDHLGIRQILFIKSDHCEEWCRKQSEVPGVWWKQFSGEELPAAIAFKSDGLKLRGIDDIPNLKTELKTWLSWQVPIPRTPSATRLIAGGQRTRYAGFRMRAFDCNSPDILGYAVATDGAKILAVLSHKKGETIDTGLYENVDSYFFWMYMPVDQDEYLSDICLRTAVMFHRQEIAGLMFSTNKGRSVVFGQYRHENTSLARIAKLPNAPCRLYFNQVDPLVIADTVTIVAFEQDELNSLTSDQTELPGVPHSITTRPNRLENDLWVYTSCSMVGITEVHLCVDDTVSYRPIIGMLLYYTDNHRECVGQIRLDWFTKPIFLNEKDKLYISGEKSDKNWAYISTVTTQAPLGQVGGSWLEVGRTETLEWWFSSWHSVLDYNGQRLD